MLNLYKTTGSSAKVVMKVMRIKSLKF